MTSSSVRSLCSPARPKTGGVGICTCGTVDGAATGTVEVTDDGAVAGSAGTSAVLITTAVPHLLQKTDSGGTRLPQREQNEPIGSEVVSMGRGITGADSIILLRGRDTSIFFFWKELPELPE
jgi:hypothetical protein